MGAWPALDHWAVSQPSFQVFILRHGLLKLPRLALDCDWSSCLKLPGNQAVVLHHQAQHLFILYCFFGCFLPGLLLLGCVCISLLSCPCASHCVLIPPWPCTQRLLPWENYAVAFMFEFGLLYFLWLLLGWIPASCAQNELRWSLPFAFFYMTFLLPEMRADCWPSFPRVTLTVGVTRVPAHTVSYKHGFVFTRVYYGLCGRYFVIWVFLCLVLVSIYRFLVSPSVAFSPLCVHSEKSNCIPIFLDFSPSLLALSPVFIFTINCSLTKRLLLLHIFSYWIIPICWVCDHYYLSRQSSSNKSASAKINPASSSRR